MVLLFVCCALIPIMALAIISFSHVRKQLNEQSQRRLHQASKSLGMTIYERLLFIEAEMGVVGASFSKGNRFHDKLPVRGLRDNLGPRFKGLLVSGAGHEDIPLLGKIQNSPELTKTEKQHIESGKTLVYSRPRPNLPARIFMSRVLDSQQPRQRTLVGEIDTNFLWGIGDYYTLPPLTTLCVLDNSNYILICSGDDGVSFPAQLKSAMTRSPSRQFDWTYEGKEYLASSWVIPIGFNFLPPHWTVVLSELKSDVFAPMADFKRIFPFVVLLSLLVVLLLSIRQIRCSLVPLERLKAGTQRIAKRDFASQVKVRSGDEFEELAESFNTMASRLGRQFETLATMAEIDRAILSALDTEKIVETVLARLRDVFPSDYVSVTLFGGNGGEGARTYLSEGISNKATQIQDVQLHPDEVRPLFDHSDGVCIADGKIPDPLAPFSRSGIQSLLVLPIVLKQGLSGIVALGHFRPASYSQEDMVQARQLSDQVAIAIYNSRLYEEMKDQADSLARANRVKNEFLSVMSHELKTPLTIIMSLTESMREGMFGKLTKKQSDTLKKVTKQSGHLLTMINTLMETTGLEAEVIKVEIETFSLGELLEEIRSTYDFPLNNGLTLEWDTPTDPIIMKTDRRRVKLILQHLIDNAIKFTEQGQVKLSVRWFPTKETVEFTVMDTGIGIPTEALPVIFDKLVQWDSSETRCYGGVGLGLYVVKAFTELLSGRVEVESQPGEGSTFTVNLPVDYHGAKGAGASSKSEGNGLLKREWTGRQISAGV